MKRARAGAALGLLLVLGAGCNTRPFMKETVDGAGGVWTFLLPEQPIALAPVVEPIPLQVALVVDPSLRAARWEPPWTGSALRFVLPLGAVLPDGAERVARSAFVAVDPDDADAVLRVRFDGAAMTLGGLSARGGSYLLALALEWRLEDPAGRLVWADTVVGRAPRQAPGTKPHPVDRIEQALADLFARSQQSLTSAPEIRALAEASGS